jgi:hypothetical protein
LIPNQSVAGSGTPHDGVCSLGAGKPTFVQTSRAHEFVLRWSQCWMDITYRSV